MDEIIQNGYHSGLVILKWSVTRSLFIKLLNRISEEEKSIDIYIVIWNDE